SAGRRRPVRRARKCGGEVGPHHRAARPRNRRASAAGDALRRCRGESGDRSMRRRFEPLLAALLVTGCSYYSATDTRVEATKELFAECTQEYGYDPGRTEAFGEHELGPGELEWRACAYHAV